MLIERVVLYKEMSHQQSRDVFQKFRSLEVSGQSTCPFIQCLPIQVSAQTYCRGFCSGLRTGGYLTVFTVME
jgi:hypothetical protein